MGGGDLNMKKSWHPLLLKNQERVWLEEKKALEEKKKLDQLRKEKDEERQMQELQRLQEEQTGKKRVEKLDWMYATPATGSSQNANELEDYLLGKKRVDKILTADENERVGAAHKNFIATQYANTVRDTAAKIREDPLLAIKQQEQAAYQALMSNPLRLREMQERNGIKPKKDKKEKKHKRDKHRERSLSPYQERRRSPDRYRHDRSRDYDRTRAIKVESDRVPAWPKSDESDDNYYRRRSRSSSRDRDRKRRRSSSRSPARYEPLPPKRSRMSSPPPARPPPAQQSSRPSNPSDDRAARLAAMSTAASSLTVERREHLTTLLAQEKAELELEEKARMKSKGMGGFLSQEQKKVFGGSGGIEDRIRRGRGQMRADAD